MMKTSLVIVILISFTVTIMARAGDLTPEQIYAERLAAADRAAKEKQDAQKEQSKTWEQRAQEEVEVSRARHEQALRRESPAARAAREKEEREEAKRRAAAETWCAEHPVECAAQKKAEEAARAQVAALQRQRQEADQAATREIALKLAERQMDAARQAAAEAGANLNQRVIAALSSPGTRSPDQERVFERAWKIAGSEFPHDIPGQSQRAQQLTTDEAFVRDTLRKLP